MDYNPFNSELKDERLEFVKSEEIGDNVFIYFRLKPLLLLKCPVCFSDNVVRNGTKKRQIKGNLFNGKKTFNIVVYTRYKCNNCSKMFMDKVKDCEKKDQITNSTKLNVLKYLKTDMTFKTISNILGISDFSVIEIFKRYIKCPPVPFGEVLCVDEFKNLKQSDGKFAFLMYNPLAHIVNDVLPERTLVVLNEYFYKYDYFALAKVKYFISDMYETYRTIKKTFFPNATHIVDSFHYIRYVTDAFNKVRIRIQDSFDTKTWQYKILKRYAKLFTNKTNELSVKEKFYNQKTGKLCTASVIITDALSITPELSEAYNMLQSFYIGWNKTKMEEAKSFIYNTIIKFSKSTLKEFNDVSNTFKNWKDEIINSFIRLSDRRLNNDYIEGINNKIKAIKKAAYGFKVFELFRLRIMYLINPSITIEYIK